jgi:predicted phage terminase large subunit-like protein
MRKSGSGSESSSEKSDLDKELLRAMCEDSHLFFTRYFFKIRQAIKFKVNWHHILICDHIEMVLEGIIQNLVINVAPGASKTELVVINFIARGLSKNPRARFLHLSGSDSLASLNSATARDMVMSDEFQELWPMKVREDSKSKKRWNVEINGQPAGGVYATALGGQITGFRAGHMEEGFQGAIIIDDPVKPDDAYSRTRLDAANRKLISTVDSRRANPATPVVVVMQRLAESDPTGFIESGSLSGQWDFLKIPAVIDEEYIESLAPRYQKLIDKQKMKDGRASYWEYKEPLERLLQMERGEGTDQSGSRVSRFVFTSQYQQKPTALGGNIIKGEYFKRYKVLPKIKYRKVFADTAQKTKKRNDFTVFEEWGYGDDGRIYLIDMIRIKVESPELKRRAVSFWAKCKARDVDEYGQLREMCVEDKSSGTDLIQTLKLPPYNIPIKPIQRNTDKLSRVMDGLPYIESGQVCIPEDAPFIDDFVSENEAFTADDSHDFDDQIDPMLDAIQDMLSSKNKLKVWEELAKKDPKKVQVHQPQTVKIIAL